MPADNLETHKKQGSYYTPQVIVHDPNSAGTSHLPGPSLSSITAVLSEAGSCVTMSSR